MLLPCLTTSRRAFLSQHRSHCWPWVSLVVLSCDDGRDQFPRWLCRKYFRANTHTVFTSHRRGLYVVVRFLLPAELFQRAGSRKVVRTRLTQIHQHPTYWPIRAALAPCSSRRRPGSMKFSRVGTGCGQRIILTRLLTLHCFSGAMPTSKVRVAGALWHGIGCRQLSSGLVLSEDQL